MSDVDRPKEFKDNVIDLCDLIIDIVKPLFNAEQRKTEVSPLMMGFGKDFLTNYDPLELINNFIKYSHEHWDQIHQRDAKFFEENSKDIFKDLPLDNIDPFKELFIGNLLSTEDKDDIWEYFTALVCISILYIHYTKTPIWAEHEGQQRKAYNRKDFFHGKRLSEMSTLFGVKLLWPGEKK